ncbi:tetraacyldisaccharide 4'-kinase [Fulvivirgaceae bacterium BMA10]|uniref:Tetraacyldisaccharide 4'-kinase n=1 Tax=Splendidivirga corallicola TaxID=3051826 RepID=A0ABT8KIZ3_9BACT|nr:tetraacyldisaccharide 4'-kinase [Fulvivirgaceae bacterium BMA10]
MYLIRILLSPISFIYYALTRFRNHLYNIGYRRSFKFDTLVINVGNLTVGGTGKTPMIEYLIRLLRKDVRLATLSRGYGRKTKGFRIANDHDSARTIGDEPYQIYLKFKHEICVSVGEERALAIPEILFQNKETQVILMDDAYQHRSVVPDFNILLSDYNRPFYNDWVMPSGRLREPRRGAGRADMIIITKCPEDLTQYDMDDIIKKIGPYKRKDSEVFFTGTKYSQPKKIFEDAKHIFSDNVILFSGIARDKPLVDYVQENFNLITTLTFSDHHNYSKADIVKIRNRFEEIQQPERSILTTEKDMVKLLNMDLRSQLIDLPLYYLPIESYFLKNGHVFDNKIKKIVKQSLN